MDPHVDRAAGGLTWRKVRRWLLFSLVIPSLLLTVYLVKSALLHRTLGKIEARGGVIGAMDAPPLLDHLMGRDQVCRLRWIEEPPSWPVLFLDDHYALHHRCALEFWSDPGDEGLALAQDLSCIVELQVPSAAITDAGLAPLRELVQLESLNLGRTRVTGPGLAHLRGLPRLRTLILADTALDDKGFAYLGDLPRLEVLDVQHTLVTRAGARHLTRLRSLRSLSLGGTKIDDQSLDFLAGLPLTYLDLRDTGVTDAGLRSLERLPELSWISLENTAVSDAGLESLKRLRRLSDVDLRGTRVTDEAARRALGKAAGR